MQGNLNNQTGIIPDTFSPATAAFITGLVESAEIIRPSADLARGIYDHAEQKATEAGIQLGLGRTFLGMIAAEGILYAHAAELAMKCVLQQTGKLSQRLRKSHHLGELFDALPDEVKQYAEAEYRKVQSANNGNSLAEELRKAGVASITLRYLTETRQQDSSLIWLSPLRSAALLAHQTIDSNGRVRVPKPDEKAV